MTDQVMKRVDKCPVMGATPREHARRIECQPEVVAGTVEPEGAPAELAAGRPDGQGFRLRRRVQDARSRRVAARHRCGDDRLERLVARRLRPLRSLLHPHGVAQRRHVPDRRRPRRFRLWHAAFRAPQQLARQRQPRQGAPAALADQAEVRANDGLKMIFFTNLNDFNV